MGQKTGNGRQKSHLISLVKFVEFSRILENNSKINYFLQKNDVELSKTMKDNSKMNYFSKESSRIWLKNLGGSRRPNFGNLQDI